MPTQLKLNPIQLSDLRTLRDKALQLSEDATGAWAPFYQYLAQTIRNAAIQRGDALVTATDVSIIRSGSLLPKDLLDSMVWLMGGRMVNSDEGAFSKVIRMYNIRQGILRGKTFSQSDLQKASNAVGANMATQILGNQIGTVPGNGGSIPTVTEIGAADLLGVRDILYPGNSNPGDPLFLNQAWPGILMLGKQGQNFLPRLVSAGQTSKTDRLKDIQDLLFAWDSFRAAFDETGVWSIDAAQDVAISLGILEWKDLPGAAINANRSSWWFDLLTSNQDRGVATDLKLIHDISSNKFLEMLMGATEGTPKFNTVTNDNFATKAKEFFSKKTPTELQSTPAKLYTSATALISAAQADVDARVALGALSFVSVKPSTAVANKFDLFDEGTGQGHITQQWIRDRADMLKWLAVKFQMNTDGPVSNAIGGAGSRYFDQGSKTEVLLGTLPTDRKQFIFGTDNGDAQTGQDESDHLFGGNGADTLNGGKGNDYLEGGDGVDSLVGGDNSDDLRGGAGADTYTFSGNYGTDSITDSDGQGSIKVDDQDLPSSAAKKVADNIYRDKATGWSFTKVNVQTNGTADLVIQKDGSPNNSITIRNWTNGQLGINLSDTKEDAPPNVAYYKGDQRPLIYGVELFETGTTNSYAWGAVTRDTATGDLTGKSKAEADFSDVIVISTRGTNDDIQGFGGNDALSGLDGNDKIDGGTGDDLIGGGVGSDTLIGGAGHDFLIGGGGLNIWQRYSPADKWTPPAGQPIRTSGARWGVYLGDQSYIVDGGQSLPTDDKPDYIDGGTGNDNIVASYGNDYADGGDDNDSITGLAGNDSLFGGKGNDWIVGDGISSEGYYETTPISLHGDDVLDGGAGNDTLIGQGGKDQLFGGANDDMLSGDATETPIEKHDDDYLDGGSGNDKLYGGGKDDQLFGDIGDDTLNGDDTQDNLAISAHGKDYLDGGAGTDELIGGGNDDELFGGDDDDTLLGDDTQDNVAVSAHGKDYLDGEKGNDQLVGGGNDDELFGDQGNDSLWGDDDTSTNLAESAHGKDYLDGGDGNDQLIGGGQDDILIGGADNDNLWGDGTQDNVAITAHGNDYLDGGDGIDLLVGGGKDDTLTGGIGNDSLWGDDYQDRVALSAHGIDYLDGGDGDDTLAGGGMADTLYGGSGNDYLWGDDALDRLAQSAHGNDHLDGGEGDDTIHGDGGDDILHGGSGDDRLSGEDQIDQSESGQLSALTGNDTLYGETGADILRGGMGDDVLDGGDDNDTLLGGEGNDRLDGGSGNDTLFGGNGDDTLVAGAGDNYLSGGAGNNTYVFSADSGNNTIDYSASNGSQGDAVSIFGVSSAGVTVYRFGNTALLSFANGAGALELRNVIANQGSASYLSGIAFGNEPVWSLDALKDKLLGVSSGGDAISAFNSADNINSGSGDDTVHGAGGDDLLNGGDGQDQLFGDAGDDILAGGIGNDLLNGGAGKNTYRFDYGSGQDTVTNDFGGGADVDPDVLELGTTITTQDVRLTRNFNDDLVLTLKGNADTLTLSAFFQNLDTGGTVIGSIKFADTTWGVEQIKSKALEGTSANDRIIGYASADTIYGGDGNDALTGLMGADSLVGGAGDDSLYAYSAYGSGFDKSNNTLDGGQGNDSLIGDAGNDLLQGGTDRDTLIGGYGNDTLDGGTGPDSLYGGDGSDTYIFNIGSGQDTIDNGRSTGSGSDTLLFGDNIKPSDVSVRRSGLDLTLTVNPSADSALIKSYFYLDGASASAVGLIQFKDGTTWNIEEVKRIVQRPTPGNDLIEGYASEENLSGGDGNDTINGNSGNDTLSGGLGVDQLSGGYDNDLLQGNEDNDALSGEDGNDTLDGGAGNDTLDGGRGNNTYLFAKGDGQDRILSVTDSNTNKLNTLQFKNDVQPGDVSLQLSGNDLWVKVGTQDKITIESFATGNNPKSASNPIQQIKFENGNVIWDLIAITRQLLSGDDSGQYLPGFTTDDAISGRGGDDTIYGASGNDTIDGGPGLDVLTGGPGDDLYLFGKGDGQDIILTNTASGETNSLKFKAGVTPDDIKVMRADADLILSITQANDRITVRQFFANDNPDRGYNAIQQITFTDSATTWDIATITTKAMAGNDASNSVTGTLNADLITGLGGDDVLLGQEGNDTIDGGSGNDQLAGGLGNDTYRFGKGDGQDTLARTNGLDSGEVNTLEFKPGLAPKDITVTRSGNDLILSIIGTQDQVTASQFFGDDYTGTFRSPLQQVTFADAGYTPWTLADLTAKALAGTNENDRLTGTAGANLIGGQAGDDVLFAQDGNDTLDGGTGNDRLSGGAGNDTYRFGTGDGQDTIIADNEVVTDKLNTLEFKSGLAAKDIAFARVDNDLVLSIINTADKLTISQFFGADDTSNAANPIQQVTFKGGDATLNLATILSKVLAGSTGADTIAGTLNADVIKSQSGDDALYGKAGNDTLDGGTGKDVLAGGFGNDTYQFGKGDGQDVIAPDSENVAGKANTLEFKTGVAVDDVAARRVGNDLILSIVSTTDQITVSQFFNAEDPNNVNNPIQRITFVDSPGTAWDLTAITNKVFEGSSSADYIRGTLNADGINGQAGIDMLYGQAGKDTLDGGANNDFLSGGAGNDTYKFGKGDGQDTILIDNESIAGKLNTLTFKAGVLPGEVQARRNGNNLELSIANTRDKIIVSQFFSGDDPSNVNNPIQQVTFTDSTETWNLTSIKDKAVSGTPAADKIIGTLNADTLAGGNGADILYGQAGDDVIEGGAGNDQLSGGLGNDTYKFGKGDGQDVIGSDIDPAVGKLNTLLFKPGVASTDVSANRKGNDLILAINNTSDQVIINNFFYNEDPANSVNPIQQVQFDNGSTLDLNQIKPLVPSQAASYTVIGTAGADLNLNGTATADTIYGLAGGDSLRGGGGGDYLDGGADNDGIYGGNGATDNDTLIGGTGDDTLDGRAGDDTLDGGAGNDVLQGGSGSNTFLFGFGSDADGVNVNPNHLFNTLQFKPGITEQDVLVTQSGANLFFSLANSPNDRFSAWGFFLNNDPFSSSNPINQVRFNDGTVWSCQDVINRALRAGAGVTIGTIYDDTLEGGLGSDDLTGGLGNNTYVYNRGDGQDLIRESADPSPSKLNTLYFKGDISQSEINAKRNGANLELRVAGSPLAITVSSFFLDDNPANLKNPIQQIQFENGNILDLAAIVALLPSGMAGPVIGTPGDDAILGSALADTILGQGGADTLTGAGGGDRLEGGADNDSLVGGNGTTDNDVLLGGWGNDILNGQGGDDTLDGGAGNDTLQGDLGSNTFLFGFGSDSDFVYAKPGRTNHTLQFKAGINEQDVLVTQLGTSAIFSLLGSPTDKFTAWDFFKNNDPLSSGSINVVRFDDGKTWSTQDIVNKALQCSSFYDKLVGTKQGDVLTGNYGLDTLDGGLGDNTYVFGLGSGNDLYRDTIQAVDDPTPGKLNTLLFTNEVSPHDVYLHDSGNGNLIVRLGTSEITVTGFFLNNDPSNSKNPIQQIQFANGIKWDLATLTALTRSDYWEDWNKSNSITGTDASNCMYGLEGNDTIIGRGGIDHLFGGTDGDVIYGGEDTDWLYGEEGSDFLDGGPGADFMLGGSDDDTYFVDNTADRIMELTDQMSYSGIDNVISSVSYALPDEVEVLQLIGAIATEATGNEINNLLFGNDGHNRLSGLGGADFLSGASGNDTLDGGAGADTLQGGAGDDVYYIDSSDDLVIESASGGRDTVRTTRDYIAPENVELLIAMGLDNLTIQANDNGMQLTGNSGNNLVQGGNGIDWLSGGGGFDTLQGGAGNDLYYIRDRSTRIIEARDGGTDDQALVYIDNYVMADYLDRVALANSSAVSCFGNDRKNTIRGNHIGNYLDGGSGGDILSGGGGNDTLHGGTSMDLLTGEAGDDLYVIGRGDGMDVISNDDANGNDTLLFEGIDESQLWFRQSGNDLTVSVIGTTDGARISLWFTGQERQIDTIKVGATGKALSASRVATLVQSMSTMTPPASGQTTLPPLYQEKLNAVIAANWV